MIIFSLNKQKNKQVHSLCVDSRPGDRLWLAKGDPPPSSSFFCQTQSEAHSPPSAMAVRKTLRVTRECRDAYTYNNLDHSIFFLLTIYSFKHIQN